MLTSGTMLHAIEGPRHIERRHIDWLDHVMTTLKNGFENNDIVVAPVNSGSKNLLLQAFNSLGRCRSC